MSFGHSEGAHHNIEERQEIPKHRGKRATPTIAVWCDTRSEDEREEGRPQGGSELLHRQSQAEQVWRRRANATSGDCSRNRGSAHPRADKR